MNFENMQSCKSLNFGNLVNALFCVLVSIEFRSFPGRSAGTRPGRNCCSCTCSSCSKWSHTRNRTSPHKFLEGSSPQGTRRSSIPSCLGHLLVIQWFLGRVKKSLSTDFPTYSDTGYSYTVLLQWHRLQWHNMAPVTPVTVTQYGYSDTFVASIESTLQ